MATDFYIDLPVVGGGGSGVSSLNSLTGGITLAAGTNITLGTVGNTITINAAATNLVTSVFGRTGDVTAQSGDYTTSIVTEGTNLYFTNARAIASTLTGYTSGAGTISSSDSILSAIQKLNGNTAALLTGVSSVNSLTGAVTLTTSNISQGTNLYFTNAAAIAATLTGYSSTTGTISSSDSILTAIEKLNGNQAALVTGVSSVFGRTGAVVSAASDYAVTQIAGTAYSLAGRNVTGSGVLSNLQSGITLGTPSITDTGIGIQQTASVAGYSQNVIQNTSSATNASTDFVANNNLGTATTYYANFGINSSGYTGSGSFNLPSASYLTATSGDLSIGTTTANAIHFVINNGTTDAMTINTSGQLVLPALTSAGLIINNGSGVISNLANSSGSNGQVLTLVSGSPAWQPLGTTGSFNNVAITGISGNGYISYLPQSSSPSTPATGFIGYADATGNAAFVNSSGISYTVSSASLSATRTFTLPDATGNFVIDSATQTITNKTISGSSNTITNINGSNVSSGTILATYGGTGVNGSTAGNGKLLIGNGSGYTLANLTSTGSTITVTNTSGGINLDVTSGVYVPISGGTMTGSLILNANPTVALGAVTKQYVDASASGILWKSIVNVATTGSNITLSGEQTIDGVLTSSSRVLVKDQTTSSQNGIYVSGSGAWTRSSDANTAALLNSAACDVASGSINGGTAWIQTATVVTVGTSAVTWVNFINTTYTAGNGLQLTGKTFSVLNADTTLSVTGSGVAVATGGITNTQVSATAAIARSKLVQGEVFTKPVVEAIYSLTYGSTIAVDATQANIYRVTLTGATAVLSNPTGATDGQKFMFEIKQDGTGGRLLTFGTNYQFGTDLPSITLSTAANAVDLIGMEYVSSTGFMRVISLARGFT